MKPILSDFSRFPHPLRLSIRPLRRIAGTKSPSPQIAIVIHPSRIRQSADMTMDGDALESRTDGGGRVVRGRETLRSRGLVCSAAVAAVRPLRHDEGVNTYLRVRRLRPSVDCASVALPTAKRQCGVKLAVADADTTESPFPPFPAMRVTQCLLGCSRSGGARRKGGRKEGDPMLTPHCQVGKEGRAG